MTKQFNVELPASQAKKIKLDAVESGITLNEYARRVFRWFLALKAEERRKVLNQEAAR